MNRAIEYMDLRSSTPVRQPASADEPVTLVDVFERVARKHKRPDTLNYKSGGRWLSVSSDEMLRRSKLIAAGLHAIGAGPGERVAILSESRVEWTLTDAGSIFAGTIDVPIYPTLTPPQVRYILNDSGASVLFLANREKFDELKDALGECPQVAIDRRDRRLEERAQLVGPDLATIGDRQQDPQTPGKGRVLVGLLGRAVTRRRHRRSLVTRRQSRHLHRRGRCGCRRTQPA